MRGLAISLLMVNLAACGGDPHTQMQETVGYRDGTQGSPNSGERGTVIISEIGWAGSVHGTDKRDVNDVFIELQNLSHRPLNLSGWRIVIEGARNLTLRVPASDKKIPVGGFLTLSAKSDGCFPHTDFVLPHLKFPTGDPFRVTLRDADERLMEPAGSTSAPPFAGGYDLVSTYSMERIHLMFGQGGGSSVMWMFSNPTACPPEVQNKPGQALLTCYEEIPNNDLVAPACRRHTYATPGRANSPDYSGAYASGGLE